MDVSLFGLRLSEDTTPITGTTTLSAESLRAAIDRVKNTVWYEPETFAIHPRCYAYAQARLGLTRPLTVADLWEVVAMDWRDGRLDGLDEDAKAMLLGLRPWR